MIPRSVSPHRSFNLRYSRRCPPGYCQGLNLLAATLLLIHESEENAFWTFKATISILPEDFYAPSLLGSRVEQAVLQEYVEELLPEVADKLEDLGLELSTITFGWLLSLFVNCLPIEVSPYLIGPLWGIS